jgi:cytochrome b involved in lipid metabolism
MMNKYTYLIFLISGVLLILLANRISTSDKLQNDSPDTSIVMSDVPKSPTLTIAETAKHNRGNDCYIIVNDKIYNITTYFGKHPGGNKIMFAYCGKETSQAFAAVHSNFAWDLLEDYYIGDITK